MKKSNTIFRVVPATPAALALTMATVMTAIPAQATNGYFSHGYGIKNKALAGAGIALPQDALTIAINPAGLVNVKSQFNIGVDWFKPKRGAEIHDNAFGPDQSFDGNDTESFWIPELAYSHRFSDKLVGGVAVYGNGGMNTDYKQNPYARYGADGDAGVDLIQLFISPAVAWKLTDDQQIGVALNAAHQRFRARGLGLFGTLSASDEDVSNRGYDSSNGWSVRLGWQGHFAEREGGGHYLTVGATWQSETRMDEFDKYKGLFAEAGDFDIPENYGVGLAFHPNDRLDVALDYQRINYSDIKSVGNSLDTLFDARLGDDDGPGFGWRDGEVIKLGVSYRANEQLTLRLGYSDGKQPVPTAQTFFNILAPGVIRRHASLGASWALDTHNEISVTWMHGFKETITGRDSIPSAFGGGEADIHLEETSFGIAWSHLL